MPPEDVNTDRLRGATNEQDVITANRIFREIQEEIFFELNFKLSLKEFSDANPDTDFRQQFLDFLAHARGSRQTLRERKFVSEAERRRYEYLTSQNNEG